MEIYSESEEVLKWAILFDLLFKFIFYFLISGFLHYLIYKGELRVKKSLIFGLLISFVIIFVSLLIFVFIAN